MHTEQGCLVLKKVEVAFILFSGSRRLLKLQRSSPSCWVVLSEDFYKPPKQTYLISKYSSMPYFEPSRPKPDCFTPPKGHSTEEIIPSLTPTIPTSSCSATLQI